MATLTKRHVYKNGGASYAMPGVKASVYVGPKMFNGPAPDYVTFDATNLATADAAAEAKKTATDAAKAARAEERAAKKTATDAAKAARAEERANKKAANEKVRADKKAAKEAAKAAQVASKSSAAEGASASA